MHTASNVRLWRKGLRDGSVSSMDAELTCYVCKIPLRAFGFNLIDLLDVTLENKKYKNN